MITRGCGELGETAGRTSSQVAALLARMLRFPVLMSHIVAQPSADRLCPADRTPYTRPRVGIPWRTGPEEDQASSTGLRGKTEDYLKAVEKAGAEGVLLPLRDEEERNRLIPQLDAFVLPGSPADVEPARYGTVNRGWSAPADLPREETDRAILKHALAEKN